jgi:DNA (cytosine-5)-methyltransferase 1
MRHLDLFSGIGGFSLAAQWVWGDEYENVGFCDNNKFCQAVLKKNFPNAIIYDDIRTLKGSEIKNLDLLTGGFPCQPFSFAGKRRGESDDRYLWPQMLRVIQETRPRWIVGENVAGIVNLALDQVLADLENEKYEIQAFIIPAVAVGAPHRRDRVWIVGHDDTDASGQRDDGRGIHQDSELPGRGVLSQVEAQRGAARSEIGADIASITRNPTHAQSAGQSGWLYGSGKIKFWGDDPGVSWLTAAAALCGMDDGFSAGLDGFEFTAKQHRIERIKALGNAIVPQVATELMREIRENDFRIF